MGSEYFSHASDTRMDTGHFNSVKGRQTNNFFGHTTKVNGNNNTTTTNNYGSNNIHNYDSPQQSGWEGSRQANFAPGRNPYNLSSSAPPDLDHAGEDPKWWSGQRTQQEYEEAAARLRRNAEKMTKMYAPQSQLPPNDGYGTQPPQVSHQPHLQRQHSPYLQKQYPSQSQPNQEFQQPPLPHSQSYPSHDSRYQTHPGGYGSKPTFIPSNQPPSFQSPAKGYPYQPPPPQTRGDEYLDAEPGPSYSPPRKPSRSPWGNPPPPETPLPSEGYHYDPSNESSGYPYDPDVDGRQGSSSSFGNSNPSFKGNRTQYDRSSNSNSRLSEEFSDADFLASFSSVPSGSASSDWSAKYYQAQERAFEDRNPFRKRNQSKKAAMSSPPSGYRVGGRNGGGYTNGN